MAPRTLQTHAMEIDSSPDPLGHSVSPAHPFAGRGRRLTSPTRTVLQERSTNSNLPTPTPPTHALLPSNSPMKAITEQTLSPWKIRVTVEAEPENELASQGQGQVRTQTYTIPLKMDSSPAEAAAVRGRVKKAPAQSSPARKKRSGTPVRTGKGRRKSVTDLGIVVLGDESEDNEWSPRKKAPIPATRKRRVSQGPSAEPRAQEAGTQAQEEDTDMYGAPEDQECSPEELREIDLNRVSVRARSGSMKQKEKPTPGTASNYPTPSPTPSILGEGHDEGDGIMPDGEGEQAFDTILESEGMTMIDLHSLPSANRALAFSSPEEAIEAIEADPEAPPNTMAGMKHMLREPRQSTSARRAARLNRVMPRTEATADETELSSNVASSPPPITDYLKLPQRSLLSRKVTPDVYSSPNLPSPPKQARKETSPHEDVVPTRSVVNANKALHGALLSPNSVSEDELAQPTPTSTRHDFLEGFSSGTKREMRAGLRFGEELAKRQSSSDARSSSFDTQASSSARANARGSTPIPRQRSSQSTPDATNGSARTKNANDGNSEQRPRRSPLSQPPSQKPQTWTAEVATPGTQRSESSEIEYPTIDSRIVAREHEWQLEREAVARQIDEASPSKVIVIDDSSLDDSGTEAESGSVEAGPPQKASSRAAATDHDAASARRSDGRASSSPGAKGKLPSEEVQQDRNETRLDSRADEALLGQQQALTGARGDHADAGEEDVTSEEEFLASADETDLWLDQAQRSSSSPFTRPTNVKQYFETQQPAETQPRRGPIPSPWKRGENVEESTIATHGEASGIFWQEQVTNKFGATSLAMQTRRVSQGNFDVNRMLSSPAKEATAKRNNLKLRAPEEESSIEASETDESSGVITVEGNESSLRSSPPRTIKIPMNFGDDSVLVDEVTPPSSKSSHEDEPVASLKAAGSGIAARRGAVPPSPIEPPSPFDVDAELASGLLTPPTTKSPSPKDAQIHPPHAGQPSVRVYPPSQSVSTASSSRSPPSIWDNAGRRNSVTTAVTNVSSESIRLAQELKPDTNPPRSPSDDGRPIAETSPAMNRWTKSKRLLQTEKPEAIPPHQPPVDGRGDAERSAAMEPPTERPAQALKPRGFVRVVPPRHILGRSAQLEALRSSISSTHNLSPNDHPSQPQHIQFAPEPWRKVEIGDRVSSNFGPYRDPRPQIESPPTSADTGSTRTHSTKTSSSPTLSAASHTLSSTTEEGDDAAPPPTPRSAMKGGRISAGVEEPPAGSPKKGVVLDDRARYLNDDGDESTMSAHLDSPPPHDPVQRNVVEIAQARELEDAEVTSKAEVKKAGTWSSWLWRGKGDQSSSEISAEEEQSSPDQVQPGKPTSNPIREANEQQWAQTRTALPTHTFQPPKHATRAIPPKDYIKSSSYTCFKASSTISAHSSGTLSYHVRPPQPPSYLLSPSYPSLRTRDTSPPLPTSGPFTNTHFRTLHILHAKSLLPSFHPPKYIRPEIDALLDIKSWLMNQRLDWMCLSGLSESMNVSWIKQSSEGDADPVKVLQERAIQRAMRKVGGGAKTLAKMSIKKDGKAQIKEYWHGLEAEGSDVWTAEMGKVGWGWTMEEVARMLGMVVIGEVVRREEAEMLVKAQAMMKTEQGTQEGRCFEEFEGSDVPSYVITSHRWVKSEVSYKDFCQKQLLIARNYGEVSGLPLIQAVTESQAQGEQQEGLRKILSACKQAVKDEIGYLWHDSCCIDKTSSAELSEAINSMFAWYERSSCCYTYLSEVPSSMSSLTSDDELETVVRASSDGVFTRGWCLQELLAPKTVSFFGQVWQYLGSKTTHPIVMRRGFRRSYKLMNRNELLSRVTGVPMTAIDRRKSLYKFSVAQRMSWAAERRTTRVEDLAYSLLGLFQVNMALLYGEGQKSFTRLQEEIARQSADHSLLAWRKIGPWDPSWEQRSLGGPWRGRMLASSPAEFRYSGQIVNTEGQMRPQMAILPNGLELTLPVMDDPFDPSPESRALAVLSCRFENDISEALVLGMRRTEGNGNEMRLDPSTLSRIFDVIDTLTIKETRWEKIILGESRPPEVRDVQAGLCWLCVERNSDESVPEMIVKNFRTPEATAGPGPAMSSRRGSSRLDGQPGEQTGSASVYGSSARFSPSDHFLFNVEWPTLGIDAKIELIAQISLTGVAKRHEYGASYAIHVRSVKSDATGGQLVSMGSLVGWPTEGQRDYIVAAVANDYHLKFRLYQGTPAHEWARIIYVRTIRKAKPQQDQPSSENGQGNSADLKTERASMETEPRT
ncbi:Vegetative incompatibility protein HET-E-1 [Cyphellophora attinorum]|uniref:Vegetative incompatibility protein HET-E-1 n=1 Tax=Cyphellophora attinorum TaxID=1664694 RepID=A0A0N1GY75_9EURO|nr:Vegetative incompatibility protein HET-E-1 [Phialophora attinorum]KPI35593.1 Vegetative incompatibility protein HET-E-1 [Phialophora attinorum]